MIESVHREKIDQYVGTQLQALRVLKKLSQREVAASVGVSIGMLQAFETGQQRPDPRVLWDLARLYEVSLTNIFNLTL